MSARRAGLRLAAGIGAGIGYGSLLAFLYLIGMQTYRWFREGAWTHIGMGDGIRIGLVHCCVKDGGGGRLASFLHWWESPATWLGMHKVFEVIPASLALFAVSIVGNSLFIYCRDRLQQR
ncbi:MAG: hypothetical protein M3N91_05490 [Pseudomonadota bacterium]|nr:hypothetical protein [Pseudomonadota bacterium]